MYTFLRGWKNFLRLSQSRIHLINERKRGHFSFYSNRKTCASESQKRQNKNGAKMKEKKWHFSFYSSRKTCALESQKNAKIKTGHLIDSKIYACLPTLDKYA